MIKLFRLIRWLTILFAAITMLATRYFVIKPVLSSYGITMQTSRETFFLLFISVASLIAAAYIINDYFDIKADRISGVRELVIGKTVSRRKAIILHTLLNFIAIVCALYISIKVGNWKISLLFILISALLWFYSSQYKKLLIAGNLIVALLISFIPLSVILFEVVLLSKLPLDTLLETGFQVKFLFKYLYWIPCFTFFTALIYEINKDIFSWQGDKEKRIKTISVVYGQKAARYTIIFLIVISLLSLILYYHYVFPYCLSLKYYFFFAIGLPYLIYIIVLFRYPDNRFLQLNLLRFIMLMGVLSGSVLCW